MVLLVACSAFFSASETAISSFNKIRMRSKAEDGNKRAKTALKVAEDFDKTISTILIGNNIVTAAAQCRQEISVQDLKGAVADAKSILGLMNLDFSQPVEICGDDPAEVEHVYNAVRH